MLSPVFRANLTDLNRSVARYSGVASKGLRESWLRGMRGVVKRAMGITPPATGGAAGSPRGAGGGLTKEDELRGRDAIARDLALVFTGVTLKNKRAEQLPDVAGKHRELFIKYKKAGKPLRSDLGRGRYYHVDQSKLKALFGDLRPRVGRTASGWLSGGEALGITGTPGWVSRHGTSRGTHRLVLDLFRFKLTVANMSVPDELVPEMSRRLDYAIGYAAAALTRETEALLRKGASEAGFGVR